MHTIYRIKNGKPERFETGLTAEQYAERVGQLEAQGLSTSDAQGVLDAQLLNVVYLSEMLDQAEVAESLAEAIKIVQTFYLQRTDEVANRWFQIAAHEQWPTLGANVRRMLLADYAAAEKKAQP